MDKWSVIFIIIGASLWGTIGIFVQGLYNYGLTPLHVVTIRAFFAAIIIVVFLLIKNRSLLKIDIKDYKYFIGTGILSIVFFNWFFFTAIKETSLSVAAILLYTGPAFVTIISRFLFKEWLTKQKLLALFFTLVGCVLVIGLFPLEQTRISLYGIVVGISSGFCYALYSIFGKYALAKYHSQTVTAYTFIFASIALLPISGLWKIENLLTTMPIWGYGISLGLFPTVLAYLLYTKGLEKVETSKASITATIEPVVAAIIGIFIFGDILSKWQFAGIFIVLSAVTFMVSGTSKRQKYENVHTEKTIS